MTKMETEIKTKTTMNRATQSLEQPWPASSESSQQLRHRQNLSRSFHVMLERENPALVLMGVGLVLN